MAVQVVQITYRVECESCEITDEGTLADLQEGGWTLTGPHEDLRQYKCLCWRCKTGDAPPLHDPAEKRLLLIRQLIEDEASLSPCWMHELSIAFLLECYKKPAANTRDQIIGARQRIEAALAKIERAKP